MKKLMKNGLSLHNALPTFNPLPISAFGLRQGQRKSKAETLGGEGAFWREYHQARSKPRLPNYEKTG
jgi:hypothetical protein